MMPESPKLSINKPALNLFLPYAASPERYIGRVRGNVRDSISSYLLLQRRDKHLPSLMGRAHCFDVSD